MKKLFIWVGAVILVGGAGYLIVLWGNKAENARPGVAFSIMGRDHIAVGATHAPYNSNPPTSGPHYAQPADWGVYDKELPDEQLVHNLEHGGIWISYKGIDADTKSKLEAFAKKYSGSVIMTPRALDDTKIVLASWGRLEKFETFDEQMMTAFIKANTNKSPEPLSLAM